MLKAVFASLLLLAVPLAAQEGPDLDFVFPFDFTSSSHPLDIRQGMLDFLDNADDEDLVDLYYLLFLTPLDDPENRQFFESLGVDMDSYVSTEPHPNDARVGLEAYIQEVNDGSSIEVALTLEHLFGDPEVTAMLFPMIGDGPPLTGVLEASEDDKGRGKNTDWESGNCWDRIPQRQRGPFGSIIPTRDVAKAVCKQKPHQCRGKRIAYRGWARLNGVPCKFKGGGRG